MARDRRELMLHGYEVPSAAPPTTGGGGNSAWRRAQRLALELHARNHRN